MQASSIRVLFSGLWSRVWIKTQALPANISWLSGYFIHKPLHDIISTNISHTRMNKSVNTWFILLIDLRWSKFIPLQIAIHSHSQVSREERLYTRNVTLYPGILGQTLGLRQQVDVKQTAVLTSIGKHTLFALQVYDQHNLVHSQNTPKGWLPIVHHTPFQAVWRAPNCQVVCNLSWTGPQRENSTIPDRHVHANVLTL